MPNPILSICIPTFNRAEFLRQNLNSIISQFKDSEVLARTEIVISDNGSVDNTQEVVKEFQGRFNNIQYFKNQENLGFDRNVLSLVEKSKGEYCWLMGDDDAFFADALSFLLPLLSEKKYEYLLANSWGHDKELINPALRQPNLHLSENKFYSTLRDFVCSISEPREIVGTFGGMSGQIFRRKIWQDLKGKEEFIGSQTVHLFVILKAFRDLPALVIAKPLVKTRADNMRWGTFPGLETVLKRAEGTKKGIVWIFNQYNIPYSKLKLEIKYYWNILYSLSLNIARKTIFKNQKVRNFVKKLMGK